MKQKREHDNSNFFLKSMKLIIEVSLFGVVWISHCYSEIGNYI